MCLGVPGRIERVWTRADGAPMARADFAGQPRDVCLAYLPQLAPGEWVIAHLGFAVTAVDEPTAAATIATMQEYGVLPAELPATSLPAANSHASVAPGGGA